MSTLNVGVVGPAESGKSTISKYLVLKHDYRRHALAHPLKVTLAFAVHDQLDLPILGYPAIELYPSVHRITHGIMGWYENDHEDETLRGRFDAQMYRWDCKVRDFLVAFTDEHKPELRGAMQQYGTEVVRNIAAKLGIAVPESMTEPWLKTLGSETASDNAQGIPATCDDIRHIFEADFFANHHDAILVKTRRNKGAATLQGAAAAHSSEQYFDKIPTHFLVQNNGDDLGDLHECIEVLRNYVAIFPTPPLRRFEYDLTATTPLYSRSGLTLFG